MVDDPQLRVGRPAANQKPPPDLHPNHFRHRQQVTLWAVITDPARSGLTSAERAIGANVALIDPLLTLGMPPRITAGTA
jgi:hypothetical protein